MDRRTQIEESAGNGKIEELRELLEPTHSQLELDVALENAIAYSRINVAKYLLNLGANFANYNYQGVYYAVHNNEIEGLKFSVSHGVDINILDGLLINTSIETAMNTGDCQILKWLLSNGANPKLISQESKRIAKRHGTLELQQIVKDATENRSLKITGTYIIGVVCLVLFFIMKNSSELHEILDKAERTRADYKFGIFAITGLIQYGLLTISVSTIVILTALLVRRKIAR
ncbi:hypothetical protein QQ020_21820 [Fulvivirgaceae bacterium BMA12]|uniref:Uncharacterized protein n=1 Tax=Agaribacillus aureus TaxID=3051825 RepID=A0ABT8LAG3_9BACT|nr:hypothetical protein [Fulvivirgaceae bacterium BMA12]